LTAVPVAAFGTGAVVAVSPSASAESYPKKSPVGLSRGSLGWVSGVTTADPEAFGVWRRSPVGIVGMFADASLAAQRELYQFVHGSENCDVDLAVGGPIAPSRTWAQAAAGSEVPLWRETAALMRDNWRYRTVYLRFAHEANGTWMKWSVSPAQVPAFARHRDHHAERTAAGTSRLSVPTLAWRYPIGDVPGSDAVDVVGVSRTNGRPITLGPVAEVPGLSIGPDYWLRSPGGPADGAQRVGR
jgi:hypothetical protein